MKKPNSSAKTVKKEIIEIESDTTGGGMLKEIIEIDSDTDEAGGGMLKEIIEIDSDTDEVGGGMLALCGEVNASCKPHVVSYDDSDSGLEYDVEYKKYLASHREHHSSLLERDSSPLRILYIEDHKPILRTIFRTKEPQQKKGNARPGRKNALTKNSFKTCKENEASRAKRYAKSQTIFKASKRLKTEKTIPRVNTKETQPKKEDAQQGRKSFVTRNNFKACKKENEVSRARRNARSQTIFRASKRLKTENGRADHNSISRTIPVVYTKQKKGEEAQRERKIPVTKKSVQSNSTSHVKDNLPQSFEARKKDNEESRSLVDKSYEYFLSLLRSSITIVEPGRKVKPVKDAVGLSDPDIIAISNYPFSDGDYSPFEANKDGKVIDLEDGTEPDIIFNSTFSKKLMEILRKPYDDNEFSQRRHEASLQRQLTRCRELRDGRDIEYNVDNQLTRSYLEQYPDFNKKFRRCCHRKDPPRALNLLRGFFFYFENIVLEGAFKPWMYEKRVKRECEEIKAALPSSSSTS